LRGSALCPTCCISSRLRLCPARRAYNLPSCAALLADYRTHLALPDVFCLGRLTVLRFLPIPLFTFAAPWHIAVLPLEYAAAGFRAGTCVPPDLGFYGLPAATLYMARSSSLRLPFLPLLPPAPPPRCPLDTIWVWVPLRLPHGFSCAMPLRATRCCCRDLPAPGCSYPAAVLTICGWRCGMHCFITGGALPVLPLVRPGTWTTTCLR